MLVKEQQSYYLTHSKRDKGVHAFPKSISLKVNVIVQLGFELAHFETAVQPFNFYATGTPPLLDIMKLHPHISFYIPCVQIISFR